MSRLRFVHAADLHLDAPLRLLARPGREAQDLAIAASEASFRAFDNLIELCLRERVAFLVIAGDLFDEHERSLRARFRLRDGLARLAEAGIPTFIAHGNHDALDGELGSLELPDAVTVFGPELDEVVVEQDGAPAVRILGVSFATREVTRNLALTFPARGDGRRADEGAFRVGVLHCNVGQQSGHAPYAPCELEDLVSRAVDYWALGHVHTRRVLRERNPTIVYPGSLQGGHHLETGPRGAYLVEVEGRRVHALEFVALDAVRWFRRAISIEQLATESALESALRRELARVRVEAQGRPSVVRLRLHGRGPLHPRLTQPGTLDALAEALNGPEAWIDAIETATAPDLDLESRARGEDFVGELLRTARRATEDATLRDRLAAGLQELHATRALSDALDLSDPDTVVELLAEAERMCVDALLRGEASG